MVLGANLRAFIQGENGIEAVAASHLIAELLIVARKMLVK